MSIEVEVTFKKIIQKEYRLKIEPKGHDNISDQIKKLDLVEECPEDEETYFEILSIRDLETGEETMICSKCNKKIGRTDVEKHCEGTTYFYDCECGNTEYRRKGEEI